MTGFKDIDGDYAIINVGGLFKQVALATLNNDLYAKIGSGYVRLNKDRSSSKAGTRVITLNTELPLYHTKFGKLTLRARGTTPLTGTAKQLLLSTSED